MSSTHAHTDTYLIWHVISNTFSENWRDQFRVDLFGVEVVVLGVEEEGGGFRADKVCERLPYHGEAEDTAIL